MSTTLKKMSSSKYAPNQYMADYINQKREEYKDILDKNFPNEINCQLDPRLAEILAIDLLSQTPGSKICKGGKKNEGGPDFKITINKQSFFVECVAPNFNESCNLSSKVKVQLQLSSTLTGRKTCQYRNAVKKNLLDPNNPYVLFISLNSQSLSTEEKITSKYIENIIGTFLKAGGLYYQINNRKEVSAHCYHEQYNVKSNGTKTPKNIFLDKEYRFISAVIISSQADQGIYSGMCEARNDMIIIHNPSANNKLPEKLMKAEEEYRITKNGDSYEVKNLLFRVTDRSPEESDTQGST